MPARPFRRRSSLAMLGAAALAVAACGGSDSSYGTNPPPAGNPSGSGQRAVAATPQLTFSPATLTVQAGQSVTFQFGAVAHNVFFDAVTGAPEDIPGSNANTSVVRTFGTAGTFPYTCHLHTGMSGTVVVQ